MGAAAIGFLAATSAQAMSVDTSVQDPNAWLSTILGPGVSIVPGSILYQGGPASSGTFTNGLASGIGINTGLILTSGDANLAPGPNTNDSATGSWYADTPNGDSRLEALSGVTTYDASVLEFDFTVSQDQNLYFNYVFASDEYNEYANSAFNDVFGFFLDGVNIALIPGTNTPVSINTVNAGNPDWENPPVPSYPQYFNNNDTMQWDQATQSYIYTPAAHDIQYDGFTDVFTAAAQGLTAGRTYHMALGVADGSDSILDSAVFIQAGTFSGTYTPHEDGSGDDHDPFAPVPEPASIALMGLGLMGLVVPRKHFKVNK